MNSHVPIEFTAEKIKLIQTNFQLHKFLLEIFLEQAESVHM